MRYVVSIVVALLVSLPLTGCVTPTSGAVRCEFLPDGSWFCAAEQVGRQGDTGAPGM